VNKEENKMPDIYCRFWENDKKKIKQNAALLLTTLMLFQQKSSASKIYQFSQT
jgi:hypothetical protein